MWLRTCLLITLVSHVLTQRTHTSVNNNGASFEWGWQLPGDGAETSGHYYLNLPQSSQRVEYTADGSGYHGAVSLSTTGDTHTHTVNFALGEKALQLHNQQTRTPLYQNEPTFNTSEIPQESLTQAASQNPVDIFLLQQYPTTIEQQPDIQVIPNTLQDTSQYLNVPNYYYSNINTLPIAQYNLQTQYSTLQNKETEEPSTQRSIENAVESSTSLPKEVTIENSHESGFSTDVVQVFKNHNCSKDIKNNLGNQPTPYVDDTKQSTKLYVDVPEYNFHDINGLYGEKTDTERPLTYRGAVHFTVEHQRENARNEKYHITTENTPLTTASAISFINNQGISKLVASTQDLINNDDLLKINHAAEKNNNGQIETVILKPKSRFSLNTEQTRYGHQDAFNTPRSRITVRAKVGNIVNTEIDHGERNSAKDLRSNSNDYIFSTPIVVQGSTYNDYNEQIVNNLVSTIVPYLQDGYEMIEVRKTKSENSTDTNEDYINVTPRPVGQKYLAPITVALRLLNSNHSEILNALDDPETSDTQIVQLIHKPKHEKTIVDIQESIPLEITHINAVEHHEYMDEGRSDSKGELDLVRSLYNKYLEVLEANKNEDKYNENSKQNNSYDNDSTENIESNENKKNDFKAEASNNQRNEYIQEYYDYGSDQQKVIQPIVIEKQVPITQFVDRYIEKPVPYPEPYEVVKEVSKDVPIAIPVPYDRIVEKPVEVTKYVDKVYPVEVSRPYPVEVKVPYPVEQKVYIDRPVHIPYPIERVVENNIYQQVPVPTPVAYPVEVPVEKQVLYPYPVDRPFAVPIEVDRPVPVETVYHKEVPVPYPVEKRVPYPVHVEHKVAVPIPIDRQVPVTVEKIVEKPVTITKYIEKPVHIRVPYPQPYPVRVPQPYPVEKKVPVPVPVDRIVEKKIPVPYPVEKLVEKIVEKPVYYTKYVDKPYPVEKRVPYPVEKIVEKKVPYPVHVPYEVKVPYAVEKIVEKPVRVPNRLPYAIERPLDLYNYGYNRQPSHNYPHYIKLAPELKPGIPPPHIQDQIQKNYQAQASQAYAARYQQYLKDQQPKEHITTTHWGNLHSSSYQYINNTDSPTPALKNYLNYLTNSQNSNYYGPPPVEYYNGMWENQIQEEQKRRTDRTPKVSNLRLEYGFKPPLIPSTEIDLDGMPIKKEDST